MKQRSVETSLTIYQSTRSNIPEDLSLQLILAVLKQTATTSFFVLPKSSFTKWVSNPWPATTFLNCDIPQNFRNNLGSSVYHLLLLFDVRPAHEPTITGVALRHKKAGDASFTQLSHYGRLNNLRHTQKRVINV